MMSGCIDRRLFLLLVTVVVVLQQSLVVSADEEEIATCDPGYPATCEIDGNCITECNGLKREVTDNFCIPESGPDTPICNNFTSKCCKNNTGAIMGICIAIGAALLAVAAVFIYLGYCCEKKEDGDDDKNKDEKKDEKKADGDEKVEEAKTEP